ncbi:MAG TPA: nucleoside recognition domain-containing protein [Catalimonadaceae bacterium]|nr:nucleoside recognition domain-containing protein [Catalimonadaceae bacterium]
MLQIIWLGFFVIGLLFALFQLFFGHNYQIFNQLSESLFNMAKTSFELGLGLAGIMSLWLGLLKVAERGGMVEWLSRKISPFFSVLFPSIPANHPAQGSMLLNFAANMLGLDNAATPLGLKAMEELQTLNTDKETASDAQILFLLLNASGLTIVPISIMAYRSQMGAGSPSDVFLPILFATFASTVTVLMLTAVRQKLPVWRPVFLLPFLFLLSAIVAGVWVLAGMGAAKLNTASSLIGNGFLAFLVVGILVWGYAKKVEIFNSFIDGAKEGFQMCLNVIPFLVAMLCAIAFFRSSGALDFFLQGISWGVTALNLNADFVPAIPTMLLKPLSGAGSRGMMLDAMKSLGPDSFAGRLACIVQGSADTTFYIMTVYFGAVRIKNIRYALGFSLLGDLVGFIAAIFIAYLYFHL